MVLELSSDNAVFKFKSMLGLVGPIVLLVAMEMYDEWAGRINCQQTKSISLSEMLNYYNPNRSVSVSAFLTCDRAIL